MSVSPNNISIEESQKYSESYRWIVLGVAVTAQTLVSVVSQGMYTLVPFLSLLLT